MKKIYFLSFAAIACSLATAQTTLKVKMNKKGHSTEAYKAGAGVSTSALAGNITCSTQYTASTSMTLNFTLTFTNTDFEYGDSLAITFPSGMTPTGSANNPFAPITDNGAGQTPEALNGVSGQTISWGDDDNNYGGIESLGNTGGISSYNFSVNVTIGAITGTQTANFHLSGDGYGASPADLNGTIQIFEAGTPIDDASCTLGGVQGTSFCNNTTLPIAVRIKNLGNTTLSNFPVSYQIDANTPVTETVTVSIAPNDSTDYTFTTMGNFSAEANYSVVIWTSVSGEDIQSNDTLYTSWTNSVSVPLTSTNYTNDFETNADFIAVTTEANPGSISNWGVSQTTFQSGAQALFMTAPSGVGDAWVFLKCMDVVSGDTYRITFWKRTNTNFNGSTGISYGSTQNAAGMTNVIMPVTANTANATWVKDSADFSPATGTIYIGFRGQGTATGSGTNCRLDNINIFKVVPTGINNAEAASGVAIFPNPSNGILNINISSKEAQVAIYNVIGEQVMNGAKVFSGSNVLDLSSLSAGTYFVRVTENEKVVTQRITLNK